MHFFSYINRHYIPLFVKSKKITLYRLGRIKLLSIFKLNLSVGLSCFLLYIDRAYAKAFDKLTDDQEKKNIFHQVPAKDKI